MNTEEIKELQARIGTTVSIKEIPGFSAYMLTSDGRVWSSYKNGWLAQNIDSKGYKSFMVCGAKTRKRFRTHRLLAELFLGGV